MGDLHDDRVVRLQADRLCIALGLPKGSFIPFETIRIMAESPVGTTAVLNGENVVISPSIRGVATIVLRKIKESEAKVSKKWG